MPLKKQYDFSFIGLTVSEDKSTGPGGSHSVEELFSIAQQIFRKAISFGFKPSEIFFDSAVFPLAIDMPMEPGVPGYTYRAFNTIRKIKSDPQMKNCHFSLGVSNCCRDLPGGKSVFAPCVCGQGDGVRSGRRHCQYRASLWRKARGWGITGFG